MRRCLNPKNPHKNMDVPTAVPVGVSDANTVSFDSIAAQTSQPLEQQEQQVTCQFCKYLLEEALLGDCRVSCWIGSGTFGDVYEAEQIPPLSRRVAVKVMAVEHVADGRAAELFAHEVRSIAALDHPNILPVLRVGTISEGRPYLVMKFAAHGSLQKFCQTPLPPFSVLPMATTPLAEDDSQDRKQDDSFSSSPVNGIHNKADADADASNRDNRHSKKDDVDGVEVGSISVSCSETLLSSEMPLDIEATVSVTVEDENQREEVETNLPTASIAEQDTVLNHEAVVYDVARMIGKEQEKSIESVRGVVFTGITEQIVLTPQQILPYLEGAAAALQYAHEHGIIHLDVKPANLLLDSTDRLLLADFGVSALLEGYTHASLHGYVGTPLYTAPEQWLEQPRAASDQYALAITCYQLLVGRPPFIGNLYAIMHGHIQTPPPALRQFQPLIPVEVEEVILRALEKEPTDRYEDMRSFAQAYRSALASSASSDTDAHEHRYVTETLATRDVGEIETRALLPELAGTKVLPIASGEQELLNMEEVRSLNQSAMLTTDEISRRKSEREPVWEKVRPRKKNRWRNTVLLLLVFLLVTSGGFGIVRLTNPCLLGVCPAMVLSTQAVNLTNDDEQRVAIHNPGTADLYWTVTVENSVSWLSLAPTSGRLQAGQTGYFTTKSSSANISNGTYTAVVQVAGQGLSPLDVYVTMSVQMGYSVKASGTNFSLVQGLLQPQSQKVTITNNSGQQLTWIATNNESNWLVVTPNHGVVEDKASEDLTATINTQYFSSSTNLQITATLILFGKLGNRVDFGQLRAIDFNLKISQVLQTPTPQATQMPTPQIFHFPTYNAKAASSPSAPATLRSGHGMAWDDHDNLMLVFGGIDNNSNLLNDLWSYSPGTNSWTLLSAPGLSHSSAGCGALPAPRMNAALVWDNVNQQVLLYGGIGANNRYLGDLWSFSPSTKNWTLLKCSDNGPGARSSGAVWDGHEMLLVGGINKYGVLSDFWSYTPGGKWQRLVDTKMTPRAYQTLVWDTTDSRLYVFGGLDANGVQQNDFWSYSTSSGWVQVTPYSTSNPGGRQQAMGTWDSKDNVMFLMGGLENGQGVPYYGFWVYDPKQNAWKLLTPLDNKNVNIIPGRTAAGMVWDTMDQRAYIYAGSGNDKNISSLNDSWMIF